MSFCVSCVNGVNWLVLSDQLRHLQKGYHFVKMTIYFLVEHLNTIQTFCTTLTGQYTCYLFDNTKTFCLSMPVTNTLLLFYHSRTKHFQNLEFSHERITKGTYKDLLWANCVCTECMW